MPMTNEQLKQILLTQQYITDDDIASYHDQEELSTFLIREGLMTKNLLGQALGEYYGVPFVDIQNQSIDEDIFFTIPELVATTSRVVGLARLKKGIKVGMSNPTDTAVLSRLERRYDEPIVPYFAFDEDVDNALRRYKASLSQAFAETVAQLSDGSKRDDRDSVITTIVDLLLEYGNENRASDIHIEPFRKEVTVRFRIDGVLHDVATIQKQLFEPVLSRIKILAKLRTDEHRRAQDGKIRFQKEGSAALDVRVSLVPTQHGENVVMRLLSTSGRQFQLTTLGMGEADLKKMQAAIREPHGMILVTGPTGSGKSTSLYAVMQILNKPEVHIATIEDPIEYDIEGVTQIQVDKGAKLTFADGLRAIVRQDPDIIMVGEIRDKETAGIAVNSALTGHLVLSTLHTNDAATTLPRLLDMGIEPFLVASTVEVVVAQRLVRQICTACRASYVPDAQELDHMFGSTEMKAYLKGQGVSSKRSVRLYRGAGCNVCGQTGYEGRIGVFEIIPMSDTLRALIMKHANADEIKEQARAEGMTTMMEDGISKVLSGITTLEEVLRVARDS